MYLCIHRHTFSPIFNRIKKTLQNLDLPINSSMWIYLLNNFPNEFFSIICNDTWRHSVLLIFICIFVHLLLYNINIIQFHIIWTYMCNIFNTLKWWKKKRARWETEKLLILKASKKSLMNFKRKLWANSKQEVNFSYFIGH